LVVTRGKPLHYAALMKTLFRPLFLFLALVCTASPLYAKHALLLFGEPKYPANFQHFDYVNPDAPKGGVVRLAYPVPFDSLNPFILKGLPAPGIGTVYDSLMVQSLDEPQTFYPLVADDVVLDSGNRFITFRINPRATFQDGSPIRPADVVFSLDILKSKGHPLYQLQYQDIEKAVAIDARHVRFYFTTHKKRELPIIVAALPVLSKAYFEGKEFDKTSLEFPVGSGAYRVTKMEPGRTITFDRVKEYWAANLPSRRGMNNFDHIRYDVYRDETVALEAFKAHAYDFREEYIARNWALAYQFKAVKDGRVIIDNTSNKIPRGMQAFLFNTRLDKFKDRRVREAISLTFDFEWMNRTLFYDAYERNDSLFQNTPFAARDYPSDAERTLLEPYREQLPYDVFGKIYTPLISDGSGFIRDWLKEADRLLKEAGWVIRDGKRVNAKTGEVLTLEFLSAQRSLERVVMAMKRNLTTLGIEATFRTVDSSQYQKRLQTYDFDMVTIWWNLGLMYPGSEQESYWACSQVAVQGGQNLAGYCHEAVDKLLLRISKAKDLDALKTAARALDRIILHEHLLIPHFSISHFRMAYWNMFGIPNVRPPFDNAFMTWWMKDNAKKSEGR
jgi:microcin C transport system substrate-binding protein